MRPTHGPPATWQVPTITTFAALAEWLGLRFSDMEWLADCRGMEAKVTDGPLRHYCYTWVSKPRGPGRLIEAPKHRLRSIQRRILDEILGFIPSHDAAHGFRVGRSVRTFVQPHIGQSVVLRMDLRDFFPSLRAAHVAGIFRTAGYPETIVRLLTGFCTNIVSGEIIDQAPWLMPGRPRFRLESLYRRPHLPQGAPTSPALANLCAFRLDCRLTGLARAAGAIYTRYADDLLFSGDREFRRIVERFQLHAGAVAMEEGFKVQNRKTRIMRQGVRQHAAGVVLNEHANLARDDYDRLKATLYNCVRHGPGSQNHAQHMNFREHLAGRIAWHKLINPARARKLEALFARIVW